MAQPIPPFPVPAGRQPVALSAVARRLRAYGLDAEVHGDAVVSHVTADSRQVVPGSLFCAVRGEHTDGHAYAAEAVARGASAILAECALPVAVPQVRVNFARPAVGPAAALVYGDPTAHLPTVAVTGTNGKTTSTFLARHALQAGGWTTGLIGTLGVAYLESFEHHSMTTPDASTLQATLGQMAAAGVNSVVMEASSQGLDQDRLAGCAVTLAAWLNLTPEHLDYHGTIEQYYAAKARLFDPALSERGIVCIDDEWGRRLAAQARIPVTTFGARPEADVRVDVVTSGLDGTTVRLSGRGIDSRVITLRAPVIGAVNGANIAAAYLIARQLGVSPDDAARGIATSPFVPGRCQRIDAGQPFLVLVDYAHTPDSLALLLTAARQLTSAGGKVRLVLGCRGGKDRYKRPAMGRVAAGADHAVFTSDSPGVERPADIVAQMMTGAIEIPDRHVDVELDRARAIGLAISAAQQGDVVLITGRGHEKSRMIATGSEFFADDAVALDALRGRGYLGHARYADARPGVEPVRVS